MFSAAWPWVCVAFRSREQTTFAALSYKDTVCQGWQLGVGWGAGSAFTVPNLG